MILNKAILFLAAIYFVFCESSIVDKLNKCSIRDDKCFKTFYDSLFQTIANVGLPDLGIAKLDPLQLEDVSVIILGIIKLNVTKAQMAGMKDCEILELIGDIDTGHTKLHVVCDHLVITGNYKVDLSNSLLVQTGIRDKIHGEGTGKVTIDTIDFRLDLPFHVEKRDNELYFKLDKNLKHDINIKKATFEAESLTSDSQIGKEIIKYLNENWRVILQYLGNELLDKGMEDVYVFSNKFFDSVPIKFYVIEDLSSYVI